MSRIGLKPITLPSGVSVTLAGTTLKVSGPKGSLDVQLPRGISLNQDEQQLSFSRARNSLRQKSLHGLTRALIQNAVTGVSDGFSTQLEIQGVGYRLNLAGQQLRLGVGFSHEVSFDLPPGVAATLDQNILTLTGTDKQQVFQAASAIRALKKPEPYKGKGIRFVDEYVIRKSGKAAATGKE